MPCCSFSVIKICIGRIRVRKSAISIIVSARCTFSQLEYSVVSATWHGIYIRIELPLAATVKVVCHHFLRRRHTMHDPSESKSSRKRSKHCCSGLLAWSYRWHGNCSVHRCEGVCPGDGGGWHPEERNWSTASQNLVTQAPC